MKYLTKSITKRFLLLTLLLCIGLGLQAQRVNLDEPTRAGELTLFPDIVEDNKYYYVLDKVRMAQHENEDPQFSFLNYVKNTENGAEGGGIVHALVELYVSDDQLRAAQTDLRRVNPNGQIVGPVMWKGGTIALISSFVKADGELSKQVIGIGKAPILDGQKAAVSVELTQKGAEILWESFKTPTPDMSVSFEMELEGYRAPKQATIEANFDRIYEHQAFNVGLATPFLAADISGSFEDLRDEGAIKITNVGSDEQMDQLIAIAYNKLTELMFEPISGTGTPDLTQLTSAAGQGSSMLDRATSMLNSARQETEQENQRIRQQNEAARARADRENTRIRRENAAAMSRENASQTETVSESQADTTANDTTNTAAARPGPRGEQPPMEEGEVAASASPEDRPGPSLQEEVSPDLQEEKSKPFMAIAVSYQMKKKRHRGEYRIDLNKSSTDAITMRFDHNFGPDTRDCRDCYRQVNLDNPLFKQREIVAFVDGMNASDFGEYINFVTVNMVKEHEEGAISQDEIRIDRNNFNQEGNNFKLIYGWKEDNSREDWLDYTYQATWSFFGGHQVSFEPETTSDGALNLAPPFKRKQVRLSADPFQLESAGVRLINVRLFYELEGQEFSKQLTLNARDEVVAGDMELLLPRDQDEYEYEIEWRLTGNQLLTSGRLSTSFSEILVDEIPIN